MTRIDRYVMPLGFALALAVLAPAHADLRMVQVLKTTGHSVTAPGQKMTLTPPPQAAGHGGTDDTVRITLSVHGMLSRADDGPYSTIIDQKTQQETILDRTHKVYVRSGWEPAQTYKTQGAPLEIHKTGSTGLILGHPAHEYVLSGAVVGYPISGTVWTADDLAQPAIPNTLGGPTSTAWMNQLPGLVLKMNLFLGLPDASATWHLQMHLSALSTTPLLASTFAVPAGYKTTH